MLVYLVPLLLMLLLAIACDIFLDVSESFVAAAALVGLGCGFIICRLMAVRFSRAIRSRIRISAEP